MIYQHFFFISSVFFFWNCQVNNFCVQSKSFQTKKSYIDWKFSAIKKPVWIYLENKIYRKIINSRRFVLVTMKQGLTLVKIISQTSLKFTISLKLKIHNIRRKKESISRSLLKKFSKNWNALFFSRFFQINLAKCVSLKRS